MSEEKNVIENESGVTKILRMIVSTTFIIFIFIWIDGCSCGGRVTRNLIQTFFCRGEECHANQH